MALDGGKSKEINSAQAHQPKSGHAAPAKGGAGPERKADMKGAMSGEPSNKLGAAISELKSQHPNKNSGLAGLGRGDTSHIRHQPVKGNIYKC